MKELIIYCFLFLFISSGFSQINPQNSEWMQYVEELANNEETENIFLENLIDELSYLAENPYNLQTLTKEELEKLPFLSDLQIENLLYYIYKFGPLVDIHELKNVEELDLQTITYLLPFVYVGAAENQENNFQRNKIFKYSRQELMLRTDFTLQEKSGYQQRNPDENPNKYYLGNPYYLSFRYGFNSQDKILLGIAGEKDAGERFPNPYNKSFDYYTFNLALKKWKIFDELHFGNYRLSFGQGLVLNTNFSMGKTSDATQISQMNNGIKRHISTNESQYFSGVAGKIKWGNTQINLFYSHRNQDANADSLYIYSFKTDGYHRTYNDLLKRNESQIETFGGHFSWRKDNLSIGLTSVYYSFEGKDLNPELRPYNLFYLRGKNHFNKGINYHYKQRKFSFQGETAVDNSGKIATIHNVFLKPVSFIDWIFSFRYYDKEYNAFYGKGFSESTSIQNETGFYTGLKFQVFRKWEIATYWDYFVFPWLKYNVNAPTSGSDALVQLKYRTNANLQMNLRYKYKEKSKNVNQENEKVTAVLPYEQHRWRYQLNYSLNKKFSFQTQMDYNVYRNDWESSKGKSITQSFSYAPTPAKVQIDGGFAYFQTDNWDTRISIYEKNILYAFSFPTYYGNGLRYYTVIKWKIIKPLTFYFKIASSHYFDRDVIGSGLEEIQGKEKTDVYCLLKYTF